MNIRPERWFFVFFVVSGFCSLLCQVVWLRVAMAQFGVTSAMVAIVVSVFMAGLAGGSALAGAVAPRLTAAGALRVYAGCELAIALSVGVVPAVLVHGRNVLSGASWGSGAYHLASGLWVAAVLLPFCIAMGATFPLALAALGPRVRGRSSFGHLYAANVLGAVLGTLASALVLIELLGLYGTLDLGATLNALLAAAALLLSLRIAGSISPVGAGPAGVGRSRAALAALFTTGAVSMAMEVVWVRQFAPYLGNVVYAFAIVLGSYLAATLAGSLWYRSRSQALGAQAPGPVLWVLIAVSSLVPTLAADSRLPGLGGPSEDGMTSAAALVRVALAVGPVCALIGFLSPWLVDRWSGGQARRAGLAYAINGLGCIVGPLVGGFVLLPALGERWSLFALGLPLLVLAAVPRGVWRWGALAAGVGAAAATSLARGEEARYADARVRRDATATVLVAGGPHDRSLLVNGVNMTGLTPITKFMSHLPLAFLDHPPQKGLVICFGMGTSFRSMFAWGIDTTAVELIPSVPEFFGEFHPDAAALLASPRARVVVDDGRRFLDRSTDVYDVVVIDPPPPIQAAGSSLLYSREFYRSVDARLAPLGVVQQWIPGGEPKVIYACLLAARLVFPHVRVFRSIEGWGYHLLLSRRPLPPRGARELAARLPPAAAADLVEWGPYPSPEAQLAGVLEKEAEIPWDYVAGMASPLTDDRPVNEYFLLRRLRER